MRPRQFDEDKVLKTAFDQFWRRGVRGTSLADIAKLADIQRGSLYNAFGSKEELFLRAYRNHTEDYLGMIEKALSTGTLRERLTRFFEVAIDSFTAGTPSRGCPTTRGLMEIASVPGEAENNPLRAAFADMLTRLIGLLEDTFRDAAGRGEFKGDPHRAAIHVVTIARGMVVLDRAFDDEEQLYQIADDTVDLILLDAG